MHCSSKWKGFKGLCFEFLISLQGRRKLLRGGAAARVRAVTLTKAEARSADHSARSVEKNFRLHFQLSGWALVVLSYFEDYIGSVAFKLFAAIDL